MSSTPAPTNSDTTWRHLLAVAVVAGDVSARAIARYAHVPMATAEWALDEAELAEVLNDGVVNPADAIALRASLAPEHSAAIHAAVAEHLLTAGPGHLPQAIEHAREAGHLYPVENLVPLAEHSARTCLSTYDFTTAHRLLQFADDLSPVDSPTVRARRLCDLATALHGVGRWEEARRRLVDAFHIAELDGESDLAAQAAVAYAHPAEWLAGDSTATALLQRAEAICTSPDSLVRIRATRALVEARIPVSTSGDQQLGWVSRPGVAQPLAATALQQSTAAETSPLARLTALLAWHATHRSPANHESRARASAEALDLAQHLRRPGDQATATLMAMVDAIECADRTRLDELHGVLRWLREHAGSPRLEWQAHCAAAAYAYLHGDRDTATQHRDASAVVGRRHQLPGWLAADLLLSGQQHDDSRSRNGPVAGEHQHQYDPWDSSLVLVLDAGRLAQAGLTDVATKRLRQAVARLDPECSFLLSATRAAEVALATGDRSVQEQLIDVLAPWAQYVAVHDHGWWCDGPVACSPASGWRKCRPSPAVPPYRTTVGTAVGGLWHPEGSRRVRSGRHGSATPWACELLPAARRRVAVKDGPQRPLQRTRVAGPAAAGGGGQ